MDTERRRTLSFGDDVGRYVILSAVGEGGMGIVYEAHDPKLDRRVAVKVMRPEVRVSATRRARMIREARALARISHPNVVSVHDVGEFGPGVFVAMEFVEGVDVYEWLCEASRSRREIVEVFILAGAGLAAVHEAGLVHRDFKPANIMVTPRGQVLIADFGLARLADGEAVTSHRFETTRPQPVGVALDDVLTQAGHVVGTPAYMAPEQQAGAPVSARSDQYAFCVALYEALHGHRPFETPDERTPLDSRQSPTVERNRRNPPDRVHDAIARGLRQDPEQRWPDMASLLDELRLATSRRLGRWVAVGSGGALAGAAILLAALAHGKDPRCSGADAQMQPAWSAKQRAALQTSMLKSGSSHATAIWQHVDRSLDDYARRWKHAYTESCEAATVRGEHSTALMDLEMQCLQRAKMEFTATVDLLSKPEADTADRATTVLEGLPRLEQCSDIEFLGDSIHLPEPGDAQLFQELSRRFAQVRVLLNAGRAEQAEDTLAIAEGLLQGIEHESSRLELAVLRARIHVGLGRYALAETAWRDVIRIAAEQERLDVMAAAAPRLMFVIGYHLREHGRALEHRDWAEGLASRTPLRLAEVCDSVGTIFLVRGEFAEAEREHRRALRLLESVKGLDPLGTVPSRIDLASALGEQGKYAEAQRELRRALEIREPVFGMSHPRVAGLRNNLALLACRQGHYARAKQEWEEILELRRGALPPTHPLVASSWNNLGFALNATGEYSKAEHAFRTALSIWEETLDPQHPLLAWALTGLGETLIETRRSDRAIALLESALAIRTMHGSPARERGETRHQLARALWNVGAREQARRVALEALSDYRAAFGRAVHRELEMLRTWLATHGVDEATAAPAVVHRPR